MPRAAPLTALCGLIFILGMPSLATSVDQAIDAAVSAQKERVRSQESVNSHHDETKANIARYRVVTEQIEVLKSYNGQLEMLVAAQAAELESVQLQMSGAATLGRDLVRLVDNMLAALDVFVKLDVPFLKEERAKRLAGLHAAMGKPELTQTEKFRRVLEAYQIENDYGRTMETYEATLLVHGESRLVQFLRVGRVVLMYRTLDGEKSGVWNRHTRTFESLDGDYAQAINRGIRMAKEQTPRDLLRLPILTPLEVP